MNSTNKLSCQTIINLLSQYGVEDVVLSPGSRNTPLIIAANRSRSLKARVVIDERSAGFIALGIAIETRRPVAMICTSGSAALNYGPALAEAFYRRIPLIAVTADRPAEWIDQDDSQTIRQPELFANIVKGSYNLSAERGGAVEAWYFNRIVNDALTTALRGPAGPVHINVQLDDPLSGCTDVCMPQRKIECDEPVSLLSDETVTSLAREIAAKKTLIIIGFNCPDSQLADSLASLSSRDNLVVLHEAQSNLRHVNGALGNIDATLSVSANFDVKDYTPELVITAGGALLSRHVKAFLRSIPGLQHWHIGRYDRAVDCFMKLSRRVECRPATFFTQIAPALSGQPVVAPPSFNSVWRAMHDKAMSRVDAVAADSPWCDFTAMAALVKTIPADWNIHVSNGTAIRYLQLFDYSQLGRVECNRGVSGIDGSTSTAIGASLCFDGTTLLITGDMSAQYDMGALAFNEIPPRFKMVVLNNSGGGIFRFIGTTAALEERERCFAADVRLPLRQLADGFGFAYYRAENAGDFRRVFASFRDDNFRPAILELVTPAEISADVLKKFFSNK